MFKYGHIHSLVLCYRELDPEFEFIRESFISNAASRGIIISTCKALETPYLDHFLARFDNNGVYVVGPLGYIRFYVNLYGGSDVLHCLDRLEEEGLVLYVCFGSQKLLKKEQIKALANEFERSTIEKTEE